MKNFKKFVSIMFVLSFAMFPLLSFAATGDTCTSTSTIGGIICELNSILSLIIPLLITLGVVYFIWGIVSYVINDSEEAKKKGKDRMIYGIIGFVVIFSIKGLMALIINTFKLNQGADIVSNFINDNASLTGTNSLVCNLTKDPKLGDLFGYATCIIYSSIIPLIIALTVVMFFWGVVQYVINDQEEAKRSKGKQFMIWGIIGLTVMIGVWGLVKVLGGTFGITNAIPQLPQ